jgi:GWxTD domain-containing protein
MRGVSRAATGGLLLALLPLLSGCAGAGAVAPASRSAADLTNARLSLERSQWLVGPIALMATVAEVREYLALADDAAAAAFEEAFWQRRDPDPTRPGNPARVLFERRVADADRRFGEAGYRGRRTDRGAIFVLHGEPESIDFEINPRADEPPLEVWTYGRDAQPGLGGRQPAPTYRFIKQGDLTVFYLQSPLDDHRVRRELP